METRVGDMTSPHMQWWLDAKFGMFIHWGAYSELARGEWVMNRERWPIDEYEKVARAWNPERYDPREWVRMAQDAGMRYLVCTTKHHDGFCLFGSEHNDYNTVATIGRDLMAELAEACHDAGLQAGLLLLAQGLAPPRLRGRSPSRDEAGQAALHRLHPGPRARTVQQLRRPRDPLVRRRRGSTTARAGMPTR
jgi:hypothetical protein